MATLEEMAAAVASATPAQRDAAACDPCQQQHPMVHLLPPLHQPTGLTPHGRMPYHDRSALLHRNHGVDRMPRDARFEPATQLLLVEDELTGTCRYMIRTPEGLFPVENR